MDKDLELHMVIYGGAAVYLIQVKGFFIEISYNKRFQVRVIVDKGEQLCKSFEERDDAVKAMEGYIEKHKHDWKLVNEEQIHKKYFSSKHQSNTSITCFVCYKNI